MWKAVLAGTTALAITGGSLVYAQQPSGDPGPQRWRPSAQDISAFADARIAALKAGLKLTAEQEKNWPAVEKALRDLAKARADRIMARRDAPRDDAQKTDDPIERLRVRAEVMSARAAGLKQLADAAEPLYKSLDEAQKRRFTMLAHPMRRHFALARWRGEHGWRGPDGWQRRGGWRGPDDMRGPMRGQ